MIPMKKMISLLTVALMMTSVLAVGTYCKKSNATSPEPQKAAHPGQDEAETKAVAGEAQQSDIPLGAQVLMEAYPDFIKGYSNNKILFHDGTEMTYDDGRQKSFVEKLDDADIEDMFAFKYDLNSWTPEFQQDAGRSRNEALFKKMYGNSPAAVKKHLVKVPWFGQNVEFTTVNGADKKLMAVRDELAKHPEFKKYFKSEGTFYWREVRGAKRLSAHSYGMTIDIGGDFKTYWLWAKPGAKETDKVAYQNKMPHEIVEIFEKHGFIWGGRWYHYDTMHFEYRPEILLMEKKRASN